MGEDEIHVSSSCSEGATVDVDKFFPNSAEAASHTRQERDSVTFPPPAPTRPGLH